MNNNGTDIQSGDNQPLLTGFLGFLIAMLGFLFLGPLIGSLFALPLLDNGLADLMELSENPTGNNSFKMPLFIIQGFTTFIGLIVLPWLFLYIRKDRPGQSLFPKSPGLLAYVLTAVAMIMFMGVNSFFIEWNASMSFPESMKGLEEWARQSEDLLARATEFLTTFDSFGQFIVGLFVIAVLPAIGEELVFRGILQRKMIEGNFNPHVAIWLSAALFSAIHIQFFGFIPRLLLGALFGYLYYWSGDIRVAIAAHFVNNGFMITVVYLHQLGIINYDIENTESPTLVSVIIFAIITTVILVVLHRHFKSRPRNESVESNF